MCLALPARIVEKEGDEGWIILGDVRMRTNLILTPEAGVGDWVLVHAGFAIESVSEQYARETWELLGAAEAKEGQ
ncbi:MAG: HypC/HybG/HupF family hydrogenase formation chaperone [Phycisphaerales bacterium JB039]